MNEDLISVFVPALVGLVSSVFTFFISKSNNNKDLAINDRQQLSEDEKQFRAELRETIDGYKNELVSYRLEIASLHKELSQANREIGKLSREVNRLQQVNQELKVELMRFKKDRSEE